MKKFSILNSLPREALAKWGQFSIRKGFTLVELLIVIAILGILTTAVLVAIDPAEQFRRGRDSGRLGSIDQLGHAIQSYYTAQGGSYMTPAGDWITQLVTQGEIKNTPNNQSGAGYTGCTTVGKSQNGFCYDTAVVGPNTEAVVYAQTESNSKKSKANCVGGETSWFVWSSANGRSGLVCAAGDPTVGPQTFKD